MHPATEKRREAWWRDGKRLAGASIVLDAESTAILVKVRFIEDDWDTVQEAKMQGSKIRV